MLITRWGFFFPPLIKVVQEGFMSEAITTARKRMCCCGGRGDNCGEKGATERVG